MDQSLADRTRYLGAGLFKRLPQFRGLGRAATLFNRAMLWLGASPTAVTEMRDGTRICVDLRTRTERLAFYTGRYDSEFLEVVFGLFDPDAAFLDVGANIGFYSVAVGNHIRRSSGKGHLFGFEPFEGNFNRNRENVKANDLDEVCTIVKVGLSSTNRTETLTLREDFASGGLTGNAAVATTPIFDAGFCTVPIELRRLDDLWPQFDSKLSIDFVKVDIEGHEDHFLNGARTTIDQHRPTILMEVNKPYYRIRGVEMDMQFRPLIPADYVILKRSKKRWARIASFASCAEVDNVLIVPRQRFSLPRYRKLAASLAAAETSDGALA